MQNVKNLIEIDELVICPDAAKELESYPASVSRPIKMGKVFLYPVHNA